ncbi:MAG: cyclopropane-fatty-acyl-phospholipid synthase family protein [Parvibaculum sp.]|nr:cyclopropane-fatty-acyl-phospholipid synthase family protein [Parvibaculum sp.]
MIAKAMLKRVLRHIKVGTLDVQFPDATQFRVSGSDGPQARLMIHNWRFVRRFMTKGYLAIAEAYMDGDWSTDSLSQLMELGTQNLGAFKPNRLLTMLFETGGYLAHRRNANTPKGSKRNIAFHYDLGNAFYGAWLDPSMTYSSALFNDETDDVSAAQLHKYRRLADYIGLKSGDRVLEIGCGWGGFAEVAARDYGAHIVGLTLSQEQKAYADQRMLRAGLSDKVDVRLQDYRHVDGQFDKIVSIEMFEAVGEENWPVYFKVLNERLAPGGQIALQIITIDESLFGAYRRRIDFIQRYIFPGGMLPTSEALNREIAQQGLTLTDRHFFGGSYAQTLEIWRSRFLDAWPQISSLGFDQRFKRMWLFYLCYCESGFRAGRINVGQFMLSKEPLTTSKL